MPQEFDVEIINGKGSTNKVPFYMSILEMDNYYHNGNDINDLFPNE